MKSAMKVAAFLSAVLAGILAISGGVPVAGVFAFIAGALIIAPWPEKK